MSKRINTVILLIIPLMIHLGCFTTPKTTFSNKTKNSVIEKKGTKGVIIPSEQKVYRFSNGFERFTPTIKDVEIAERILRRKRKVLMEFPYLGISKNRFDSLDYYIRQYSGYYKNQDEKIILTNFIWIPVDSFETEMGVEFYDYVTENWTEYWISGYDQGETFLRIEINISKGTFGSTNLSGVSMEKK